MDDMEQGDLGASTPTAASLRLQVTELLLGRLRDVHVGRSTREQSDVLQQIEAALEAYGSHFYPTEGRGHLDVRRRD
jgi:hypothetical protein